MNNWWQLNIEEAVKNNGSDPEHGLTAKEAERRLAESGPNELRAANRISPWAILLEQFKNILIIILLIATILSAFLGHGVEAITISVIVLFAIGLGFIQEYRAERAIEALRQMVAPLAIVMRDGKETEIPARNLVPGDIIILRAGNKIPADVRLIEAINLQIDEAALTGESVPVDKKTEPLDDPKIGIGDRINMAFAGTAVTYGRGRAVVVATGMNTEFGKIAKMLQSVESRKTPLQENLDKVGRMLARAAFVIVFIIVLLGLFRGQPFIEMLIFGVALAVAVVPEALPAVVTISLAIGLQRMVKRNALVRRLPAVETLGSTSVICSDKTGTLTKDEMTAQRLYIDGHLLEVTGTGYEPVGKFLESNKEIKPSETFKLFLQAAVLSSDTTIFQNREDGRWHVKGDPTEGALIVAAAKAGFDKLALDRQFPRVSEIPFSSETKRMTTIHAVSGSHVAYSKGAFEVILESCRSIKTDNGETVITEEAKTKILQAARQMGNEALRVLAISYKSGATLRDAEQDMVFLGLVGMIDPPRPEAKEAVNKCEIAGIKVVMITGDHPVTAQAIARELGILKNGKVVIGSELDSISDANLDREVENIDVYARVSPAHKLRVVSAFQRNGRVVAMTGDGVNDAPALKTADIGIAMGITGTDVTKEASAMMLTDDNFASIVAAVEEGRGIFANIKKYLMFLLSSNIGEIGLMAVATIAGLPLPLTAVQILYVNLATDGLPALALAIDPPENDLMRRKPRNPRTGIFTQSVVTLMSISGLWSTIVNIGVFVWAINSGRSTSEAMTMTFVSLVLIQFFNAYNFRSDRHSALRQPFANKWLNMAVVWELILLIMVVYLPILQKPFGTFALPLVDWIIIIVVSLTITPVLEIAKLMCRRGWLGKQC